MKPLAIFLASLTAMPLYAQEAGTPIDIPVEEWREMALGRTLTYQINGQFFALEEYFPSGNRVSLQSHTGECLSGTWSHSGTNYCYDWGKDGASCFRHVRANGTIMIIPVDDGNGQGTIQVMSGVSDAPLQCGQNLS